MARSIRDLPTVTNVQDIPLFTLHDTILGRLWNAIHLRQQLTMEADFRANDGLFVPHESPEVDPSDLPLLRSVYPRAPSWYEELFFPSAVPVAMPPFVQFFQDLFRTGDLATQAFLQNVLQI